jgi:hypothetical protein
MIRSCPSILIFFVEEHSAGGSLLWTHWRSILSTYISQETRATRELNPFLFDPFHRRTSILLPPVLQCVGSLAVEYMALRLLVRSSLPMPVLWKNRTWKDDLRPDSGSWSQSEQTVTASTIDIRVLLCFSIYKNFPRSKLLKRAKLRTRHICLNFEAHKFRGFLRYTIWPNGIIGFSLWVKW